MLLATDIADCRRSWSAMVQSGHAMLRDHAEGLRVLTPEQIAFYERRTARYLAALRSLELRCVA